MIYGVPHTVAVFYRLFKPRGSTCYDNHHVSYHIYRDMIRIMSDNLPYFTDDETEPLPLEEWLDELTWSPSQCYYRLQHHGVDYILYLRWRWTDPWQAYVVQHADRLSSMNNGVAVWSGDVFELHHVQFQKAELEEAKEKLIRLFHEFDGNFTKLRLLLPNM